MVARGYPQDYMQNQTNQTVQSIQQQYFPYYQDYKSEIIIGATILAIGILLGAAIIYVNSGKK